MRSYGLFFPFIYLINRGGSATHKVLSRYKKGERTSCPISSALEFLSRFRHTAEVEYNGSKSSSLPLRESVMQNCSGRDGYSSRNSQMLGNNKQFCYWRNYLIKELYCMYCVDLWCKHLWRLTTTQPRPYPKKDDAKTKTKIQVF